MVDTNKQAGQMSFEERMQAYTKAGTPGKEHNVLKFMAGTWDARVRTWMEPDHPPMETTGISERKMIFDGRFLYGTFSGSMMGNAFDGIGIDGYDNATDKYVSVWLDSTGTSILFFEGTASPDGKTITQANSHFDPVLGPMKWRSVNTIVDDDVHVFEMFSAAGDGPETRRMEITYTRRRLRGKD